MKRLLTILFVFTLDSTLTLQGAGLRVGTAVVDISPTVKPFQLRSGKSTYVHDPLHVRAVAFENGQGRVVIAVVDAIGVGREMCDEAKAAAAKVTGWKPEQMLIAGTHTHTAHMNARTHTQPYTNTLLRIYRKIKVSISFIIGTTMQII